METTVTLKGASGADYSYSAFAMDEGWNQVPGNYAFAEYTDTGNWLVFYLGETTDLRQAITGHTLWDRARTLGCNHVLAHANDDGDQARKTELRDLVEAFWPPLNRQ